MSRPGKHECASIAYPLNSAAATTTRCIVHFSYISVILAVHTSTSRERERARATPRRVAVANGILRAPYVYTNIAKHAGIKRE